MRTVRLALLLVCGGVPLFGGCSGGGPSVQVVVDPPASSPDATPVEVPDPTPAPAPQGPSIRITSPAAGATVSQFDTVELAVTGDDLPIGLFILDATGLTATNWWRQPLVRAGNTWRSSAQFGEAADGGAGRVFRVVALLLPRGSALPPIGVPGPLPTGAVATAALSVVRQ
ncbi:MAG: hypothetical protein IT204_26090 [Fimbriimonadaceae bacterium]|nr:hypothetical protein [Fimbriimonadaceae bacterium]